MLRSKIKSIYKKVLCDRISEEITLFLKNISYVTISTIIASVFSFAFNILAGRILGPNEYGKFTLINSIAMFLYIPMLFGINTAMVKYNAEKIDIHRQKDIISTSYILTLGFTFISISIYLLLSPTISRIFSTTQDYFYSAVIFAVLFVFYTLMMDTLRGLHKIKAYSISRSIYGSILLCTFTVLSVIGQLSFKSMLISIYLAYIITGAIILTIVKRYIGKNYNKQWARTLIKYSRLDIFSGVSFILYTNTDKLLINKYMMVGDVGLYNAYIYSSISILAILSGIIVTVWFPMASKFKNIRNIIDRITNAIPYMFLIGVPIVIIIQYIILKSYGDKYMINFPMSLMFAITSVLFIVHDFYNWTLNSIGIQGVKITMLGSITIAISNIILNIYSIPKFGLYGAIGATAVSYIIGLSLIIIGSKLKIQPGYKY